MPRRCGALKLLSVGGEGAGRLLVHSKRDPGRMRRSTRRVSGPKLAAVNIRCLEDIDLDAVPVQHYDGRSK